jgi:Trk K+ transport system NAD-binding subunit
MAMPVLKVYEPKEGKEKLWHFRLLLLKTASLFVVAILFSAGGLYLLDPSEGPAAERAFNATWNAFNTLTTLGDFHGLSQTQKVFLLLSMLSLVMVGGYGLSAIPGILSDPQVLQIRASRKAARAMRRVSGHVIVAGFSSVGHLVASELRKHGESVVIVERSADTALRAAQEGFLVVEGEANYENTLLSSKLHQAKALLLIFESGEVTGQVLSTTVVARALQPQIFLGALSSDESLRDWLVYAGASSVTVTEQLMADAIIGRFYHTLGDQTRKDASTASEGDGTLQEHVIIVGFDALGQRVAETLQNDGHELVILDADAAAVLRASQAGYRVVTGQADRAHILQEAHVAQARAVLIAIKSGEKIGSKLSIALMARALNPNGYILALSHSSAGSNWLSHAGASEVILIDQLIAETSVQDYLRAREPKQL